MNAITRICTKHKGAVNVKDVIMTLPASQAGQHRHRCAACAYEKGLADGRREAFQTMERLAHMAANPHPDAKLSSG